MATAPLAEPLPHQRWWRILLEVIAALLLLCLAGAGFLYFYIRGNRPQVDGSVQLAGLEAPASIIRDELGVAHIEAQNLHDLFLAQGYAMAQDRLWQMDLMRRLGQGRLAEVFGPVALPLDREDRELGLSHAVSIEAGHLPPEDARRLQAFAQGVNDFIAQRKDHLPLAFELLHYRPQPWRPEDTLALAAYMFQGLGSDYHLKLMRETFLAKLGPELGNQLFPDRSPWDVPPGGHLPAAAAAPALAQLPVFAAPPQPLAARGGSNNWAVSGARTASGKPLLANDPHLQFQIPGIWWAVELRAPQLHAAGAALAGVPGVIIGHNDQIAWGMTNSEADVQDLYRETLDGKGNVLTPEGWKPLQHWREKIEVKEQAPVEMDIAVTPHGPVIAHDAGGPLALAWTLYAPGALRSVHVFWALDEAQNWQEFEAALAEFPGPAQNFVYADTAGHIGYQLAGWVPRRQGYDGSVPVPGASAAYDWHGWIPFAQLPRAFDPASGILATANSRVTPDGYRETITTHWDAPNRTRRIYKLLEARGDWSVAGFAKMQTDVTSEQDADFAQRLVAAGRAAEVRGQALVPGLRRALELLAGFRGAMQHESAAPTLAWLTRKEFLREVVAARTGRALARQYHWDEGPVFVQWLLRTHPPQWLPASFAGPDGGGWDALLLHALGEVVQRTGLAPAKLVWGKYETLSVQHPVFSHVPLLRQRADLGPVQIDGSRLTVKQAQNPALGDAVELGPSMRFIADPADWDRSTLTLVAGESGLPFSPHYRDQFPAYLQGRPLPLWFSPEAVAAHARHTLSLH